MGIIDYWHCYLAISPLKVEILDEVKLYDILFICSFKIQNQGIDHQEAQGHLILQMRLSSFWYNWDNVSHVIMKIYSIINLNESKCDLCTMDYIPQSPTHCSKVNIECVLKCTKFSVKQANDYMFETN